MWLLTVAGNEPLTALRSAAKLVVASVVAIVMAARKAPRQLGDDDHYKAFVLQ